MLSKELAQNIVDKMMDVIPYNVNVMDYKGKIIGSGDYLRIGNLHEGAKKALEEKRLIEIYEKVENSRPGVNTPIVFRGEIIGVIGITGNPDEVRQFSKLVSVTAELLINQEYTLNQHMIRQRLKEEFIYEWIYLNEDYNSDFINRGKALGIDVNLERIVVVVENEREKFKELRRFVKDDEYYIKFSPNRIALILRNKKNIYFRIDSIKEFMDISITKVGVGTLHKKLIESLSEALQSLEIGKKLYKNDFVNIYDKIRLFYKGEKLFNIKECKSIIYRIESEGSDLNLLETFLCYMEMNGEKQKVANEIYIHRNTLNYRLEKIEEITGLHFNDYLEFFQLLLAYISYKLEV
ncbi:CdaR family transcriptional regulator [Clostridium septicum]|uniref:Carbohydrate diacid regulator n=1 Tax=Clostridium septicum TaxID=1504 RepID=A0A9N7JNT7_CLOSE|nr:sugar diacid recognition domain-containing protein [Clostridium septicum]AYE35226.1 carbohydrate diacid regulator [Clostridium septicum]UEC20123.1 helix-turn-helix domain-containing protein [Clostridium septicum]USS01820.1 helix-turn-helix domain-containing protein [Clostridium septicum]WLF70393.1 sugar diacid recognition domain-containing protein [Clostridium septicum]